MLNVTRPCLILDKFQDFDAQKFAQKGYKALLIDLDNTLVPYFEKKINNDVIRFFETNSKFGIQTIIFSNNNSKRVKSFAADSNIPYYYRCLKPFKFNYKRVINKHGYKNSEVICMGDQLITDVIGANRMHLFSIYVKPIIESDSIQTRLNRKIEHWLFKRMDLK